MSTINIIKDLRAAFDITQKELAQLLGVSSQSISRWEKGSTAIPVNVICILSYYFEISLEKLCAYSEITSALNYNAELREKLKKRRQESLPPFASSYLGESKVPYQAVQEEAKDRLGAELFQNWQEVLGEKEYLKLKKDPLLFEFLISSPNYEPFFKKYDILFFRKDSSIHNGMALISIMGELKVYRLEKQSRFLILHIPDNSGRHHQSLILEGSKARKLKVLGYLHSIISKYRN